MVTRLSHLIDDLSLRMRFMRAGQENGAEISELSERDILLLELIENRGQLMVSEIGAAYPQVSESTISTNITRLWRRKIVSKTINPENQRVTYVSLTQKGRQLLDEVRRDRAGRLAELFHAMDISNDEREVLERVTARAVHHFDEHLGLRHIDVLEENKL